jgi:pimeloyl-ACP methyl ester carboxylesterase
MRIVVGHAMMIFIHSRSTRDCMNRMIRFLATINLLAWCAAAGSAADAAPSLTVHTLAVGDKTLSYFSIGAGPAVVVVHGVGGHKEDWEGVATALAKTHHVYAIDMLGFGGSSKNGDDLSMPEYSGRATAELVMRALGI